MDPGEEYFRPRHVLRRCQADSALAVRSALQPRHPRGRELQVEMHCCRQRTWSSRCLIYKARVRRVLDRDHPLQAGGIRSLGHHTVLRAHAPRKRSHRPPRRKKARRQGARPRRQMVMAMWGRHRRCRRLTAHHRPTRRQPCRSRRYGPSTVACRASLQQSLEARRQRHVVASGNKGLRGGDLALI